MTSPPRLSPRSVLRLAAAIVLLSASVVTVASQTPALRVVSAGPTGELTQLGDADQVRILFSEPMIVLGTVPTGAAPPWIQITPAVPGSYYWSGTKMLVFSPDVNTPLPYATPFTVRIDGRAASLSGRTLGAPYEFTFTTPTVRLIGIDWYRQNGRFDSAAIMQLRFNQPVRPEDAVTHARVTLTPHPWTEPSISAPAQSWLERNDPGGLDRFRQKVARVQRVAASSDAVNVRAAATWDTQRFPPAADRVVIETTMVPPSEGWLTVTLDGDLPSPAGPARHPAQSSVVRLEPAFFVAGMRCTTNCDPQGYNAAPLTRAINWPAGGAALTITDVSNPAAEEPVAPVRALDESLVGRQTNNLQPADVGYDRQPPARTWRWRLDSDLTATDGQTLGYPWVEVVENIHALPAIGVAGTLWEASGGPTVPMSARNVRSASVWMTAVTPPNVMSLLQQLQSQRVPPVPPVTADARSLTIVPDVFAAHGVDLRRVLSPQGTGLVWLATESDTTLPGAVMPPNFNSRRSSLVQVTNLGINVKDSPQSTLVFVTRLDTGAPVPEARVSIVNASSQIRWQGATDRDGIALAPPLALRAWNRTYDLSFIVTAEKDGDLAYVASNSNGVPPWSWNLNYQLRESPTILRGSVFTDRGVYKEDDDVHLKVVLRDDTPEAMTLAAAGASFDVLMSDDRGREVDRRTITVNRWSSAEWTWHVPAGAVLGYYSVQIGRPGTFTANRNQDLVRGNFLVAAYRRPDFRVDATLTSDPQVLGATLQGGVDAKYLFGSALGSRPVRWWFRRNTIMSAPAAIAERYPEARYAVGYVPSGDGSRPPDAPLPTKTELLGPDGHLTVSLPTAAEGDAAYGYTFEGDVEDVSGQHIANRATLVVHPASLYVAINRPPMFADVKTGLNLGIVASDLTGRAVADVPVTVGLFRERWNYSALPGGAWKREEIPAGEWTVRTSSGETSLPIPLRDGGCYVIHATARDAAGRRTRTDVTFYALGPGMSSWRADGYRIDLTPERKTWKPGESARILIQSPWERATALVTVEREGIRHHRTFTIASTQDTVEVPISEADVPNVYVSVVLVKGRTSNQLASDGSDPDQPSYRVGYTELTVDNAAKQLRVDVSADKEEYRPHQPAKVSVTVKGSDGRPVAGEVTLWAMDYGLLSLTDYKTPDVLRSIYANKALQVMTEDNRVGLVSRKPLAADNGRNSTIGGLAQETVTVTANSPMVAQGQGGGVAGGRGGGGAFRDMAFEPPPPPAMQAPAPPPGVEVRQDFRPLVFWLGSATTGADGRATTDVTLPDSLTTYRIMAVAGDPQSRFGFGDHEIHVTKPLTLLPQFPRFLSQGDRASFGAVVTNSGKTPGVATVTVQSLSAGTLEFSTRTSQTLRLEAGASAPVKFDALARTAGSARVRMLVTLGTETDAFEMPLSVSAPMRLETTAAYGDTIDSAIERIVLPPGISRTAGGLNVELASTALVGLGEGARYVTEYPYECAEQKASRALALLLASDLGGAFKLTNIPADQYQSQGALALRELAAYQCGSGGFSLWPGGCGTESAYLTAYVLHVMKIGNEHGVTSDQYAIDRALQYLQTQLRQQPPEAQWWPVWGASQAFSVKVLAEFGRNQPADITRLLGVADRLPIFALSNLADALAASGDRGPRYQDVVRRLGNALRVEADRAHVEELDEDTLAWLWNSNVRATAVVLDGLSRRRDDATLVPALVRWLVAARTNGRWGTTHENAMALEALVSYYRAFESDVPNMTSTVKLGSSSIGSATFTGRSTTAQQVQLSMSDLLRQLASAPSAPAVTISRTGTGRVFYTARVQYLAPEPPEAVDRGFHVDRRYEPYVPNGAGAATTSFAPGDLVRVTVTLTLRGEGRYLALTDPLPAGFEPLEGWFKTTASDLGRQATRTNNGNDWLSVWRRGTFDHVEKHDDRVVAFATRLGSGRHEFSYLVRATTAGTFTAAGSRIEAMYAPEVTGRSAASTITVR